MNVLVCITPQTNGKRLIDKGAQVMDNSKLHILHMQRGDSIFSSKDSGSMLEELFDYGKKRGGIVHFISGDHFLTSLQSFSAEHDIGHIILGEPQKHYMTKEQLEGSILEYMPQVKVTIVENPQYNITQEENAPRLREEYRMI